MKIPISGGKWKPTEKACCTSEHANPQTQTNRRSGRARQFSNLAAHPIARRNLPDAAIGAEAISIIPIVTLHFYLVRELEANGMNARGSCSGSLNRGIVVLTVNDAPLALPIIQAAIKRRCQGIHRHLLV